jgi:hypothetical protein
MGGWGPAPSEPPRGVAWAGAFRPCRTREQAQEGRQSPYAPSKQMRLGIPQSRREKRAYGLSGGAGAGAWLFSLPPLEGGHDNCNAGRGALGPPEFAACFWLSGARAQIKKGLKKD